MTMTTSTDNGPISDQKKKFLAFASGELIKLQNAQWMQSCSQFDYLRLSQIELIALHAA